MTNHTRLEKCIQTIQECKQICASYDIPLDEFGLDFDIPAYDKTEVPTKEIDKMIVKLQKQYSQLLQQLLNIETYMNMVRRS